MDLQNVIWLVETTDINHVVDIWFSTLGCVLLITIFNSCMTFLLFQQKTDAFLFKIYAIGLPSLSIRVCSQYGLDGGNRKYCLSLGCGQ
jgi:hypothetical protein